MPAEAAARLHLRVFVSSPGDVPLERTAALALLRDLPLHMGVADQVQIDPVLWDDPSAPVPLEAGRGGQAAVDAYKGLASACQLVIAIFSGRFGSASVLDDGSLIASGTAREIDDALAAQVPVWVYRHQHPQTVEPGDSLDLQQQKLAQFNRLEAYFTRLFTGPDGVATGAHNPYPNAQAFGPMLEAHLRQFVLAALALHGKPYCVPAADTDLDGNHRIIGRGAELQRLRALVQRGHACILRAPGVGKTALAMALVQDKARLLQSFAGVLWLEFGQRPELQPQLQHWARALLVPDDVHTDDRLAAVLARIGTRRMLIVLDDVWYPEQANDLMRRLPMSIFVVTTRRNQEVACELDNMAADQTIVLDDLPEDPALALLARFAPQAVALLPNRARQLVGRVGGLPQALKLIGKYLDKKSRPGSTDILNRAFDALYRPDILMQLQAPADPANPGATQTLDSLIGLSYAALESNALRQAFVSLSVFRPKPYHFTADQAAMICGLDDPVRDFEALSDLGLIDCREDQYTLHPIVHGFAQRRLLLEWPALQAPLQNRLLDWYGDKINVMQQQGVPDQYALWYRYEYDDWQADVRDWLYYLAANGDTAGSTVAFLRVYFDAWWWWGFFQPFRFCEKLVHEWSQRNVGPAQRAGLALLQEFQTHYARGMGKRGNPAQWQRAQAALQRLRDGPVADHLAGQARPDDATRVRAVIDFALAECAAYGDINPLRGLALLQSAQAGLTRLGDRWSSAYMVYYQAQLQLEAGDAAQALATAQAGFDLFKQLGDDADPELYANLWRVRAEALLRQGDVLQASADWQRAAACALAFQAFPEPADEYTVEFFQHLAARFSQAVLALAERAPPQDAERMAGAMQTLWQPWWQQQPCQVDTRVAVHLAGRDPGALRAAVLPPMPATEPRDKLLLAAQVSAVMDPVFLQCGLADFGQQLRASQTRSRSAAD